MSCLLKFLRAQQNWCRHLVNNWHVSRDIDHAVLQTSAPWLSGIRSLSTNSKRYQQKCPWCVLAMKIIIRMLADTEDICAASWARKKETGSCCRITKKTNLASSLISKCISGNVWQESVHKKTIGWRASGDKVKWFSIFDY